MKKILSLLFIFLLFYPAQVEGLERLKVIEGEFTNPLHVEVSPSYRAEWVDFIFLSNESCNVSASYKVYQYGEVVKEGTAKIKWLKGTLYITVPLELYDEFIVYLSPNFSCEVKPARYRVIAGLDLNKLRDISVRVGKAIELQWNGTVSKNSSSKLRFNASGRLLGIDVKLYNYKGKEVSGIVEWENGTRNFTVPVKDGWTWIPGEDIRGEVTLALNLPPGTGVSATAYYAREREQINGDLLIKDKENHTDLDYPFGAMLWDRGGIEAWFEAKGEGNVLVFDFGNEKISRISIKRNEVCAELYTLYYGKKKHCSLLPMKKIHNLKVSLIRIPDGRRLLQIKVDEVVFSEMVNSPIRFWYFGNNISLISLDASLHRNPDYYVVPPNERKTNIALGISTLALVFGIALWIREKRKQAS
ncbi:hypothetical protein [Thermococcus alcaliphilus]|uniref:hypothetical protein n=1 Tax=Thermococcus alcaliphilus TaxID=139207 RepID=UPI00209127B6|nr:hypothetical protein [Thermococcus alcaliphilus]MCO6041300.1 hypothetical protein [Thermococcus alcaliphilus]